MVLDVSCIDSLRATHLPFNSEVLTDSAALVPGGVLASSHPKSCQIVPSKTFKPSMWRRSVETVHKVAHHLSFA